MCSRLLGEVGAFLDERFTSALSATHTVPQKHLPEKTPVSQQPSHISESPHCDKAPAKTMPIPTKALWNYVQVSNQILRTAITCVTSLFA